MSKKHGKLSVGLREEEQKNAQKVFLRLKNREKIVTNEEDDIRSKYSLKSSILSLVGILVHWIIMVTIGVLNLSNGKLAFGILVLFFLFVGGFFVTIYLHVLTSRKGDKEFKAELAKASPIWLYLIHIPSLLPFFSAGLSIHLARKLRKATDETEVKELVQLLKICEERLVIEKLYESSLSAIPLGITQLVILLEITQFAPQDAGLIVGFLSVWNETSAAPTRLAQVLNGHKPKPYVEKIAGLGNKGVTLLSFAFWITASRRHFADPNVIDQHLVGSTLLSALVVLLVADTPGVYAFFLEMRKLLRMRIGHRWEFLLDLTTFLVPLLGITFWTWVIVFEKDLLYEVAFIGPTVAFIILFLISLSGFHFLKNLPWLGQFSTDILLLGFIAFESFFRGYEFHDIDFTYEPQQRKEINGEDNDIVISDNELQI